MTGSPPGGQDAKGLLFGFGAYLSWGIFPAFFPLLKPAGPVEILAHRIIWTVLFMVLVLGVFGRFTDLLSLSRRTWLLLTCASALISTNWLIYIYAVNSGHVVDAALGYFINPLVSVLLGVVLLGESLNRAQITAVLVAVVAVGLLSRGAGGAPWIGLGLAGSFGLYATVKKVVPADPRVSVAVETAVASPFALAYLIALQMGANSHFTGYGVSHVALLLLCGPITAVPLLCFAAAAQRLPLVTLGLMQYLTPSMQMTWGLVVGHESMTPLRWTAFVLIWLALAVFSADALRRARATSKPTVPLRNTVTSVEHQ